MGNLGWGAGSEETEANSFQNCLWAQPREKLDLKKFKDRRQKRAAEELGMGGVTLLSPLIHSAPTLCWSQVLEILGWGRGNLGHW